MIKQSSSFILGEIMKIIDDIINDFINKHSLIINNDTKNTYKFELIAFAFWLFQKNDTFPVALHTLILDEIHKQYYDELKKKGYNFEMRKNICNKLNNRYRKYNIESENNDDLTKIFLESFIFLSENIGDNITTEAMTLTPLLSMKLTPKFKEWNKIIN